MQQHPAWVPVFAAVLRGSWCDDRQELAAFREQLDSILERDKGVASHVPARLLACFFPEVYHSDTWQMNLNQDHSIPHIQYTWLRLAQDWIVGDSWLLQYIPSWAC